MSNPSLFDRGTYKSLSDAPLIPPTSSLEEALLTHTLRRKLRQQKSNELARGHMRSFAMADTEAITAVETVEDKKATREETNNGNSSSSNHSESDNTSHDGTDSTASTEEAISPKGGVDNRGFDGTLERVRVLAFRWCRSSV